MTYREAEEYILEIPKFTKKNDCGTHEDLSEISG